jgi:hypothetical protein
VKPSQDQSRRDAGGRKATGPLKGLGPFAFSTDEGSSRGTQIAGSVLSLIWVLLVLAYALLTPSEGGSQTTGLVMTLLVIALPVALIWAVVIMLRSLGELRAEAAQLRATVEAMRAGHAQSQAQQPHVQPRHPVVERKADEGATVTRQTEAVQPTFSSRRDAGLTVPSADRKAALVAPRPEPAAEQPGLALGSPPEDLRAPLSIPDFIRALQFPETPEDKEGFRALRLALEDRTVAKLIRASQDVLTLLSQDGIYMDDLKPDLCHPGLWRRFAAGERGRSIADLGGIRDRETLGFTAARMKADPVFRDAAHHFLRTFDKTFAAFEPNATDADLAELSDTRTARAFMLFGRVTGTFD